MKFGEKVRAARLAAHYSQRQLADMTGQKHGFKSIFHRHIDRISYKITAFYTLIEIITISPFHIIQSVISR